jgi:very-short-patch-repair endonuclease
VIGRLAAGQHGVVARRRLLAAGLTRSMIEERIRNGHLVQLHRGVYVVGHAQLKRQGHWLAAVLAGGPGAVLSHRSAAALHGLAASGPARIEVSTSADRLVRGLRVHRRRTLEADDITTVEGIPTTTVARTLVDLAEVLPHQRLRKAIEEAERIRAFDRDALEAAIARTNGRRGPGHQAIRAALTDIQTHGITLTRSELEDRFLALLDAHGLPRPSTNTWIEDMEVDAAWLDHGLVVELDGYANHHTRRAFQRDRTRTNDLVAAGYVVLRFTHADVARRSENTARRISRALGSAPPPRRSARAAR